MKKLEVLLMCCLILVGCGTLQSQEKSASIDKDKAIEYTYADLKSVCNWFWEEWDKETSTLSDVEWFGTSDDEEKRNQQYYETSNKYIDTIMEKCEILQGRKIIVSGYIGKKNEASENGFFVQKGASKIIFNLKQNEEDDEYDVIKCRTNDLFFLEMDENTPIKIEAIFMKKGDASSQSELYDCKLVEVGNR